MKDFIKFNILLASLLSTACNQNNSNTETTKSMQLPTNSDTTSRKQVNLKNENQFDNLADFAHLSPIEIVNPKAQGTYEKYGIEFSGNCYTCDLAAININKKSFDIINVCSKKDFYRIENFTYYPSPSEFVVTTKTNKFIFTKINEAPVYELKIIGEKILLKGKRISRFYTQQEKLKKFKQHDCGEFDG